MYNVSWGVATAIYPNLFFDIFGLAPINYPFMMSGLGMCIGLYGYGYWVVAGDLRRYPQLVVIGFLGKALGPSAGFGRSRRRAFRCERRGPTCYAISSRSRTSSLISFRSGCTALLYH